MPWTIALVQHLWSDHPGKLPGGKFILTDGHVTREAGGWLPCHHRNIAYQLDFKRNGDILKIVGMERLKNKQKPKVLAKAFKYGITRAEYNVKADIAYRDPATWTIAVLYPQWSVANMNFQHTYQRLCHDTEQLCNRYSDISIPHLHYNKEQALATLNSADLPNKNLEGVGARMDWQIQTKYNTASLKSPGKHIRNLQKYQDLWTVQEEIEAVKTIRNAIRKENCDIYLGTPYQMEGVVVVKTLEDAYRIQCYTEVKKIAMLSVPYDQDTRDGLGLSNVVELQKGEHVCIPWAHTWGIKDWLALIQREPTHYHCIGRLDQYARGRGQIFQNMMDAEWSFTRGLHHKVPVVEMITVDDVAEFVRSIRAKVIQCFSSNKWENIDTGRRWLTKPRRIRTLTEREDVEHPRIPLVEEEFTLNTGKNASVVPCWSYEGLPVEIGVYLCCPKTKPFDVHVARTHCRYKLYVVNCTTCLFGWENKVAKRITINPFL